MRTAMTPRQRYAMFWWLLAAGTTAWTAGRWWLIVLVPDSAELITCGYTTYEPTGPEWQEDLSEVLGTIEFPLTTLMPFLLLLLAWVVAVRGPGRPRVHIRSAAVGAAAVMLDYALVVVIDLLNPVPEDAACSVDPDTLQGVSFEQVATVLGPAVLVVLAAWAGVRESARLPLRRPFPWRPVAAVVTAGLVLAAAVVVVVRLVPGHRPAPATAADGTPRHVLVRSGRRLLVVDQEHGREAGQVPVPDPALYNYTAVARDVRPGSYLAAVTSLGERELGGGRSRIYRITVDGDGEAVVGEPVGGEFAGVIRDLDVSPEGRVAYSRTVMDLSGEPRLAASVVGVLGPAHEWPVTGFGGFGEGDVGLRWDGPATLAFRGESGGRMSLLALDTGSPAAKPERRPPVKGGLDVHDIMLLPGTGRALVRYGDGYSHEPQGWALVDVASGRPIGTVLDECDSVASVAADPSGRHLLVGMGAGDGLDSVPLPVCTGRGDDGRNELIMLTLPGGAAPTSRGGLPELETSRKVLWRTGRPIAALAW